MKLRLLQYSVFERLGWAQADHRLRLDLDLFTGLGVAPHAGLAMRLYDAADARNHKLACGALGFLHRELEELVKKESCGFLRCADLLGHVGYDLRLAQWLGHLVCFDQSRPRWNRGRPRAHYPRVFLRKDSGRKAL